MRKINLYVATMAMFLMIFTSCTKDDPAIDTSEKATLSFGAVLDDLVAKTANRQALDELPACTDDAPAYVRIVVLQDGNAVVGTQDEPYRVDLVEGQLFTEEDPELKLVPGDYTLDHFSVFNADDELIWISPRAGSDMAMFLDVTLPIDISLGAGVKKYVEVPVLCYDDRDVNEYGYLFFELTPTKAYEFCLFANYCDDEGKHYTANYSVDMWLGTDATGTPLYTDLMPDTGVDDNGDFYARPVCMALPVNDNMDEDYIYWEATLLDWEENYGTITPIVLSGTLSRSDIEANFGPDGTVEYAHLRFNCPPPGGEPGIGCLPAISGDCKRVTFSQLVDNAGLPTGQNPTYTLYTTGGAEIGTITYRLVQRNAAEDELTANVRLIDGWNATHARFTLPNIDEEVVCVNFINDDDFDLVYEANELSYPLQARVAINVCPD